MAYSGGYSTGYDSSSSDSSQEFSCGNGYAGGPMGASVYGGVVPCFGPSITVSTDIRSNVEEFCVAGYDCR